MYRKVAFSIHENIIMYRKLAFSIHENYFEFNCIGEKGNTI